MIKRKFLREAGFSLIEIMVIIVIGGILLSIAWARVSTLVPMYRLEGSARTLAAAIQKARGQAISQNKCFKVVIDTANKTYQLQNATTTNSSSCSGVTYAAISGEGAHKIDDANSLTIVFGQGTNPEFFPRGGAYIANGSLAPQITLTNTAGAARSIYVQSTGRVYVQ